MKKLFYITALMTLALAGPLAAATISKSSSAPAVDDEDLANFGTQTGTDKWWPENSAAGAAKGQTFRTRNEALRFKAVTYRITQSAPGTKIYTIRIGKISGTTFTPVYSESATQTVAWVANDYVTWRLDTPLVLQPNTFYGVDVAIKSSTTPWQDGIPYISLTADEFSDGVCYNSGTSGAGNGTITPTTDDRRFHLDIEKPIGGWSLVATDPADNATNAYNSNPLLATFSQFIGRGTGNITLRNLTDGVDTIIPIADPRVVISENLLTVNPGSNYLANKAYAVRIDPTAITNVLGANYPGITNDTTWNFSTGAGDPLYNALVALKNHINGTSVLSSNQIVAHKTTIDAEYTRLADSAALITASFDLVKAYDASSGNRWYVNGLPARDSVIDDIHWTLWNVQQYILDVTYNDVNLANFESVLNGFKFGSASTFPGACNPPANSNATHTVTIKASYPNTRGWTTQGDGSGSFARKPTGCYLAPGSIATVIVPPALVGKGFKIRVGAHSWDFSNKPTIKRLDRSTVLYSINAVETKIACPHGGGIYIEVPWLANQGIVDVSVRNAVRSPYFSAKSFDQTTPTEWLTERTNAAPWADFQSDKFMMQVPRSWIYAMPDPTQLMKDWDAAMDAVNDLMGFPQIRGKESYYLQADVLIRTSVFAPGYPAVNVGGYNATANYNNGHHTHYLVRGPQYGTDDAQVEFHEQGHGYFFDKFPGETESNVNLPFVPVLHRKFGISLDTAFRASLGDPISYRTLETTAMAWMCCFNFSPNEQPMADGEKAYQLKGHAKFVDIARIYGWGALSNYWSSFVNDYENNINYPTDTDSLILRLSQNVGADVRPLLHFWGIYPVNATTLRTAITNANLVAPVEIYDRLVRYQALAPTNNSAFTNFAYKWWNGKPSTNGFWEEREHASRWDTYNATSAQNITNRVQELLNLYYPNGRPTNITAPVIVGFSPADNATNVALDANFVVTFNKSVLRGTGNIILTNLTDGTVATIAITNTSQVSIVGEVLTINQSANLLVNKTYAIQIDPTAIVGLVSNSFAGITNNTTWNFTTTNPAAGTLSNTPAAILTPNSAALKATLGCNGNTYSVHAFWNTVNGNTNAALWTNSAYVGSWTNVVATNLSYTASGLLPGRVYYHTFRATNSFHTLWATNVLSFTNATSFDWSGATSSTMSGTPANWGGTVPVATNIARWNSPTYTNAPSANADMTIGQLLFDAGNSGGVTFGPGSATLTLNGITGTGLQMNSGSGAVNTGGARFALGADQKWSNNDNSFLTVGGAITNNGFVLTLDGVGPTSLNGVLSGAGDLVVANGTNTLGGTNSYTGDTIISGGTLKLGAGNVLPDGSGFGNVTNNGWLDLNAFSETINGLSGAGTVDTVAGGTPTLTVGGNNQSSTFSGVITDTAGTLRLAKIGTGTLTLTGTNSYGGGTTNSDGIINANNAASLGSGAVTFAGGDRLVIASGLTITNAIIVSSPSGVAGRSLLEPASGTVTVSGPITINSGTSAGGHFGYTSGTLVLSGPITSSVNAVQRNGTVVFSGGGTGYTSLTVAQGTAKVGAVNGIATTATVLIGASAAANLDLNGFNQSLAGMTKSANAATIANSSTTTDSTLTTTGTSTYDGLIRDVLGSGTRKVNLMVAGGQLTLTGNNDYTGVTTVNAGTLLVNNPTGSGTGTGAVTINGGVLGGTGIISGVVTNNAGGTIAPGSNGIGTLTLGGHLALNGGSTNSFEVNGSTQTNDVIMLGASVTYGGLLNIVPTGAFTNGQTFTLFRGAGATNAGNFASLVGSPGSGKVFSFTNGVLSVVSTVPPQSPIATATVSGTNLVLSVPTISGASYVLQSTTNLTPTINWKSESTNAGNGGSLILNVPIEPSKPQKYLRLWVY